MIFNDLEREKKSKKNLLYISKMGKLTENIVWYRKTKKLSQEKLGAIFNLTRDNVASYERGIASPNIELISFICKDLKVFLHEFIEEDMSVFIPLRQLSTAAENLKIETEKDEKIKLLSQALADKDKLIALYEMQLQKK